jgi:hypothetical protein
MALYEIEAGCYYSSAIGVDHWLGIRIRAPTVARGSGKGGRPLSAEAV